MNDTHMNWLRMYRKVKGVFSDNARIGDTYKPVAISFATFNDLLEQIEKVSAADSKTTTGTYEEKMNWKHEIAQSATELASAASAYAQDENDTELQAVLAVSYSDIRYSDDQTAYNLAMTVYNELTDIGTVLEDYLVTAQDLEGLKQTVDAYHALLESTKGQESVARTKQLAGLFKKANDHLNNHLDKLVTRIKRKEPVFFDTYTSARVIQDLGGSRKQEVSMEATLG